MLAIATQRFRVPLMWTVLDKAGASNQCERIVLMRRYLALFGSGSIAWLLADLLRSLPPARPVPIKPTCWRTHGRAGPGAVRPRRERSSHYRGRGLPERDEHARCLSAHNEVACCSSILAYEAPAKFMPARCLMETATMDEGLEHFAGSVSAFCAPSRPVSVSSSGRRHHHGHRGNIRPIQGLPVLALRKWNASLAIRKTRNPVHMSASDDFKPARQDQHGGWSCIALATAWAFSRLC